MKLSFAARAPIRFVALSAVLLSATPLALGALALCAWSPPAQAAESATQRASRAAIAAQYHRGDVAVVRHDVANLMKVFASDYKGYGLDGTVGNREQSEASMRVLLSGQINGVSLKFVKSETKILSLQWRGPDAIVMSQTTMVGIGRRGNKTVRVEVVGLSRDYWGKTAQNWQIRQSVARSVKRWINGQRDTSI